MSFRTDTKVQEFLALLKEQEYSEGTLKSYRSDLRRFCRAFPSLPDSGVWGLSEYESYAVSLVKLTGKTGKPWTELSHKRHLTSVRSFLRFLASESRSLVAPELRKKLGVIERKLPSEPSALSLKLLSEVDHCLKWLTVRGYADRTRDSYGKLLSHFCDWVSQQSDLADLSELTTQRLQDYILWQSSRSGGRKGKGLSLSSLGGHITAMSCLFDSLFRRGLLLVNPVYGLERPRKLKALPRDVLSFEEILRIFSLIGTETVRDRRNRAALELLYSCGLRRNELENLNLSSVYFQKRLLLVKGKGGKERLVPVGAEAFRCLREYLENGRKELNKWGTEALFLSTRGGRLKSTSLLISLKRYAKAANITKNATLHGLRHSCATHMLAGGADIRHIQAFLGHSCLSSTQIYTRVEISDLQNMLDRCHPRDKF